MRNNFNRRNFIKNTVMAGIGVTVLKNGMANDKNVEALNNSHEKNITKNSCAGKKIIVGGTGIGIESNI